MDRASQKPLKALMWIGASYDEYMRFPEDAQDEGGYELYRIQSGLSPRDCKPMPGIGAGVHKIRIRTRTEHRVIHVAKYQEAVYVLHAFEKRTRKTSQRDLSLAQQRLKDLAAHRRPRG